MNTKFPSYLLSVCMLVLASFSIPTIAEETQPWSLRDHFLFSGVDSVFKVDPKRAEWRIESANGKIIVPAAYTEIEFGDGTTLRLKKEHWVSDSRKDFKDAFGSGDRFQSTFKPKDGLHLEFHFNRYTTVPFMTMMVVIKNTGTTPIPLKAIRPGVVAPGSAPMLDANLATMCNSQRRGAHAIPISKGQSNFMEIKMPGGNGIIGIGLLQSGYIHSTMSFVHGEKGGGKIENIYAPSINVMPNSTVQSDGVWLMLSMDNSKALKEYFTWVKTNFRKDERQQTQPKGWVTIQDEDSIENLITTARKWNLRSIQHALVPSTWQTGGVTNGNYSMSIASVASAIKSAGMSPGITLDPLSAAKSHNEYTIQAKDGSYWLDLRKPKAREFGVKQLSKLIGWKYKFFVVSKSSIPDDVLKTMNITRSVADLVAFEMMTAAAGTMPVFPESSHTIGNNSSEWKEVEHAMATNAIYYHPTGPIRLDLREVTELSGAVSKIAAHYYGPLEIIGLPGKTVRKQLSDSFAIAKAASTP